MGWEKHGESVNFAHPEVLKFKDGTVYNVRTISDELPAPIWYHSCKDASGNFVKVRCTRKETGVCAFCEANNSPEFAKAGNNERPAPLKVEYAWPVWVMEINQFKLLVGKQVWDRIAEFGKEYGTLSDTRLKVTRTNASGKIEYVVTPFKGEQVMQVPQGTPLPDVRNYMSWLERNAERVAWLKPGALPGTQPAQPSFTPQPAQPSFAPVAAPVQPVAQPQFAQQPVPFVQAGGAPQFAPPTTGQTFAQPAMPQFAPPAAPVAAPQFAQPAAAPAPAGDAQACAVLRSRFLLLTKVGFDPAYAEQLLNKHGPGIQMENKSLEQLKGIIADYEAWLRAAGKTIPA